MALDPKKLFKVDRDHAYRRETIAEDMNDYVAACQGATEPQFAFLQGFPRLAPGDARLTDARCRAFCREMGRRTATLDDEADADRIDEIHQELLWAHLRKMAGARGART